MVVLSSRDTWLIAYLSIRDSFRRHIAAHSNTTSRGDQVLRVACDACYRSKVRCERGVPCLRCTSTGQRCIVSRTTLPTLSGRRPVNTSTESHTATETEYPDQQPIHSRESSIPLNIDIKYTQCEVLQSGRSSSSTTSPRTIQAAPTQGSVSTVAFDEQRRLLAEPGLVTDGDDLRGLSWNVDNTSLQLDIFSGLCAYQAPNHNGLSHDNQARKWLLDFCSQTR